MQGLLRLSKSRLSLIFAYLPKISFSNALGSMYSFGELRLPFHRLCSSLHGSPLPAFFLNCLDSNASETGLYSSVGDVMLI